ncbi:MAG: AbrB/MazE/SpoVT family DNA-binding domain-containing protein [Burkholderiaceae bacterium]|nr:AbrB/MazE/SpoVT family DNA-binding domain-containing protein [Burkholderiaceae bacterium]
MSFALTLTAKGQFTINKQLMDHIGVKAGEKVLVKKQSDGTLKVESAKNQTDIMALAGSLKNKTRVKLTDEQLRQAITESYVRRGMA